MKKTLLAGLALVAFAAVAHAQSNDHAVVHDSRGQVVLDEADGTCVRTRWVQNNDPCHASMTETTIQQQVVEQKPVPPRTVISEDERTVYFDFNKSALTPDAKSRLDTLANDIKSRRDVKGAVVVGYADRIGTPSYNEKLSKKRAEAAKDYLVSRGIVNANVAETRWFGSSDPTANCAANESHANLVQCLSPDRRVEVEINYAAEVVAGD